jgi:simple sugar transport system ATP-binding protein
MMKKGRVVGEYGAEGLTEAALYRALLSDAPISESA